MTENRIKHYFTFGQVHTTTHKNCVGRLADYWVEVDEYVKDRQSHRKTFMKFFASVFCPRPEQFAFEYTEKFFEPEYYPNGCLCRIIVNPPTHKGYDT